MSRDEGGKTLKRFFVKAPPEAHLRLQHLALDRGTSAERLGGLAILEWLAEQDKAAHKPNTSGAKGGGGRKQGA